MIALSGSNHDRAVFQLGAWKHCSDRRQHDFISIMTNVHDINAVKRQWIAANLNIVST